MITDDAVAAKKAGEGLWAVTKDAEKTMKDAQDEEERKKADEESKSAEDDEDADDLDADEEDDVEVERVILDEDDVCDAMAPSVSSSYNSPDVKKQDEVAKQDGEVDEEPGGNVTARRRSPRFGHTNA